MITVKVNKENNKYKKLNILGHAMYDDYGKDIVCSAVSSIITTTVNGILMLDKESLSYLVSKKGMIIDIKNTGNTTQILIDNMVNLLKDLEQLFAHHKGQGSTSNGRDSAGRRLGAKAADGEFVTAGSIIYRQRGTKVFPGTNTRRGNDDSIYTVVDGIVKYERLGRDKKKASVYPVEG